MGKKTKKPDLKVIDKDGLTLKQRQFVREIVKGKLGSQIECYMKVYNVKRTANNGIPSHAHVDCSKLVSHPKVSLSIANGLKAKEASTVATASRMKEYVINQLMKESKEAESDNARITALSYLGRSIAMFSDVVIEDTRKSSSQIMEDIESQLDELLNNNPEIPEKQKQLSEK